MLWGGKSEYYTARYIVYHPMGIWSGLCEIWLAVIATVNYGDHPFSFSRLFTIVIYLLV